MCKPGGPPGMWLESLDLKFRSKQDCNCLWRQTKGYGLQNILARSTFSLQYGHVCFLPTIHQPRMQNSWNLQQLLLRAKRYVSVWIWNINFPANDYHLSCSHENKDGVQIIIKDKEEIALEELGSVTIHKTSERDNKVKRFRGKWGQKCTANYL